MRASERAKRLIQLYRIRGEVEEQIAHLEASIRNEAAAIERAKTAGVKVPRQKVAECGTEGGYYRHRRTLKETACPACCLAHSLSEKQRAKKRKEAAESLIPSQIRDSETARIGAESTSAPGGAVNTNPGANQLRGVG